MLRLLADAEALTGYIESDIAKGELEDFALALIDRKNANYVGL